MTHTLHQYQWHILYRYQWHILSIQIPMTHTLYTNTNDAYSLYRYQWCMLSIQTPITHTLYTDTNDACSLYRYQWHILSTPIAMTHTLYTDTNDAFYTDTNDYTNTNDACSLYRYQWHILSTPIAMTHTLYTDTNDAYSLYRYQWYILSRAIWMIHSIPILIPGTLLITYAPNDTLPIAIPMQPGIGNTWYWLSSMWQCQYYREPHYTELSRLMPKQCRVPLHWAKCQSCSVIPLLQTILICNINFLLPCSNYK